MECLECKNNDVIIGVKIAKKRIAVDTETPMGGEDKEPFPHGIDDGIMCFECLVRLVRDNL